VRGQNGPKKGGPTDPSKNRSGGQKVTFLAKIQKRAPQQKHQNPSEIEWKKPEI
jgi:hypothetical protein